LPVPPEPPPDRLADVPDIQMESTVRETATVAIIPKMMEPEHNARTTMETMARPDKRGTQTLMMEPTENETATEVKSARPPHGGTLPTPIGVSVARDGGGAERRDPPGRVEGQS
jgi:hypothetical protein